MAPMDPPLDPPLQLCAKLPLIITDKQETTPTFYAQYGRGRL